MGRPIDPRHIGNDTGRILVRGILDIGEGIEDLYVQKQKGNDKYLCASTDDVRTGYIALQQAEPDAEGEGRVSVFSFENDTATAHALMTVVDGDIHSGSAGAGYSEDDVLTVSTGTGDAATFSVTAVDGTGGVTAVELVTGGSYSVLPTLSNVATTVVPSGGTNAKLDLVIGLGSIVMDNTGGGYFTVPDVTISGTGGSDFVVHAVIDDAHGIGSIVVDNPGTGFTEIASVTVDNPIEYASEINQHLVNTFEGNIYSFVLGEVASEAGQAEINTF